MISLPQRYCIQEFPQTICVICVLHNLVQKSLFDSPCQFFNHVEYLAKRDGQTLKNYYDRQGIWPGVLNIFFNNYGVKTTRLKNKNSPIQYGWFIVKITWKNHTFLHAMAIVNGYVVDSYRISNNKNGIYPWKGIIYGYDDYQIQSLHKISNPNQLQYIKKIF